MRLSLIVLQSLLAAFALGTPLEKSHAGRVSARWECEELDKCNLPQDIALKETQQKPTVELRDPLAQHHDTLERPDKCDKCDEHYVHCRNSEYCWNNPLDCVTHCKIDTCDYEDCYKCGWTECSHKTHQPDENKGRTIQRRGPLEQHPDHDPSVFLTNLERSMETRADCNSCREHYEWCINACGSWWTSDKPKECYWYCEVDTCKYQDCKTTCLTWYKC